MSRSGGETLRSIPPATLAIIVTCCCVYACQVVLDLDLHHYTMNPRMIVHLNEYYRFITSCVFHGSLMHIGMNMMSIAAISSMLEKRMGTLQQTFTILWAMILTSFVYTVVALALHLFFGMDQLMYQHSVGFSGVIFHCSVLECNMTPHRSRSVFGFLTVPAYLYPWVLLVVLQLIMPNLSLLGHLSGILTGTLQFYAFLDIVFVSQAYLQEMEKWNGLRWLTTRPTFVATPVMSLDTAQQHTDPVSLLRGMRSIIRAIGTFAKNVLDTIVVAIFGRGQGSNENIQLGWWPAAAEGRDSNFDEEDWVGLPPMPALDDEDNSRIV